MKKILTYVAILVVFIVVISVFLFKNKKLDIVKNLPTPEVINMCYQYSQNTSSGFVDRAWLKMSILGDKVTGEYQNLPAEKDKKVGKFSGTVGKMDPKISGRIADVWWDSSAEGMNVKEQLNIEFGEGGAVALFGEMVDKGNGVYVYKDVTKLTGGFQMSQIDCEALDEKINLLNKPTKESVVCTMDAKQCPDGSYVGRTGPSCEFVCSK